MKLGTSEFNIQTMTNQTLKPIPAWWQHCPSLENLPRPPGGYWGLLMNRHTVLLTQPLAEFFLLLAHLKPSSVIPVSCEVPNCSNTLAPHYQVEQDLLRWLDGGLHPFHQMGAIQRKRVNDAEKLLGVSSSFKSAVSEVILLISCPGVEERAPSTYPSL